jgi:predicted RNase H-like nuclease (RuvC/YqgF family)
MTKETIEKYLEKWKAQLDRLMDAYVALVEGGVKSYKIDDRELTRFDIPTLRKAIDEAEKKIDALEAELEGLKPRKAVGVVIRDW